ncbi:MAG: hypothetical protein JNK72_15590 [Myxococcales bacterium]|nr:hypothetical protein [Myxococcales bacterium]
MSTTPPPPPGSTATPPPQGESVSVEGFDATVSGDPAALYRATVCRMMEAHAFRAVAQARLLGAGVVHSTGLRWMRFATHAARECVEHYGGIAGCYEALAGQRLEPVVERRLRAEAPPLAQSRAELAVAQLVSGRAWMWTLREHEACSFLPYRAVIAAMLRDVEARQTLAERFLSEAVRHEGVGPCEAALGPWVDPALAAFGRGGTPGAAYALSVGLRRREVTLAVRECIDDLKRVLGAAGLTAASVPALHVAEASGPEEGPPSRDTPESGGSL